MIAARRAALLSACVVTLFAIARADGPGSLDYHAGSIRAGALPTPYSPDPNDSWNRIFRALFTRDVTFRLTDEYKDGGPFSAFEMSTFPSRRPVSKRTYVRRESGDRPIAPLYPSFLSSVGLEQLLQQPAFGDFAAALRDALAEQPSRPPLERALMQADLWAVYDLLYESGASRRLPAPLDARCAELMPLVARLIHKVALTPGEVRGLADTYAIAASMGAAPVFQAGSGWVEIEWRPERSHDHDAGFRTASRVFVKPRAQPADVDAFVNRLRSDAADSTVAALEATALVTEQLLIATDGAVSSSPLVVDVQVRRFPAPAPGDSQRVAVEEFELRREGLREDPRSGGFVHETENFPAYLAAAGNDYRFATPAFGAGARFPVLGTLASRCMSCHGPGAGAVFTFSQIFPQSLPRVKVLPPRDDAHAAFVARQKRTRHELSALIAQW